jgi:hypothetical protein
MAKSSTPAHESAPAKSGQGGLIRVQAIGVGYYDDKRRRRGDVFTLVPREGTWHEKVYKETKDGAKEAQREPGGEYTLKEVARVLTAEEQFSKKWMQKVPWATPETETGPNAALRQQHDELVGARSESGLMVGDDATGNKDVLGGV